MPLSSLPRTVRSMNRLRTILRTLSQHGFGYLIDRLNLRSYVPLAGRFATVEPVGVEEHPAMIGQRMVSVCQELGPTFVKLGQMLSTRPDIMPAPIIAELRRLQDRVEPFDSTEAWRLIEEDLGRPPAELFEHIDPEPFASGSIGQVYHAIARDGSSVVVKVRRPDIEGIIQLDMHILRRLAELAERLMPELHVYRLGLIVDEFDRTIRRELDFVNEAAATSRFYEAFRDDRKIITPRVRWSLTGPKVLTLQRLVGASLEDVLADRDGGYDRTAIAKNLTDAFLKQYFELGIFHADPHPGNILISTGSRVALLDFGLVGQVDDELAGHLAVALMAAVKREVDVVIDVMADVGAIGPETDRLQLRSGLRELLEKYYGLPLKRLDLQTIFIEITDLMRRHDVQLPRDFVLLGKSIVTAAGVSLQLDPDLNLLEIIRPKIFEMAKKRFGPDHIFRTLGMGMWHTLSILKNAPSQIRDMMRRLSRGQMEVHVRHENLDNLIRELDRSSNRLSFSIVLAGLILSSSMLITMESGADQTLFGWFNLRFLGVIGYFVAFLMGMGLLWAIARSGRLS
ncbi:MAG: AarF/ABC1/UbiB kinase family protein [Phycisphaerae bacterium]|nr:AarF/ABC1/UbiB kinase family protein [Phycisphaerae bacterium]